MGIIAKLSVSIAADTSKFQQGMTKASSILKTFEMNMGTMAGKMIDFGAVAVTAAAAGLVYMTKQAMESIDATAKLADRIGETTENLTGMQYAAKLAGVDSETFNGALDKMLKNLGAAQAGSEKAAKGFEGLGLSLDDLAKSTPREAIKMIADKMAQLPNAAQKAAAAADIFGKTGMKLVGILQEGGDAIDRMIDENVQLGGSFNRIDAAKVEIANEAFKKLEVVISGVANSIAIELSPYIEDAMHWVLEFAKQSGGMGAIVHAAFNYVVEGVGFVVDSFSLLESAFYTLRGVAIEALRGILTPFRWIAEAIDYILEKLDITDGTLTESFEEIDKGLNIEAHGAFKQGNKALDDFFTARRSNNLQDYLKGVSDRATKTATEIAKVAAARNKVDDIVPIDSGPSKALESLGKKITEETRSPLEKMREKLVEAAEAFSARLIDEDTLKRFDKLAHDEYDKAMKKEEKKHGTFKEIDTKNMSVEGLKMGKNQEQKVKDPQLQQTNQLLSMMYELAKTNPNASGVVGQ